LQRSIIDTPLKTRTLSLSVAHHAIHRRFDDSCALKVRSLVTVL
jgi:hypothetical protein